MNQQKPKAQALGKLRAIIREEVRAAVRESIVPILLEVIKGTSKQTIHEQQGYVNSKPVSTKVAPPTSPVKSTFVNSLLEETRQQMVKNVGKADMEDYKALMTPTELTLVESTTMPYVDVEEPETATDLVQQMISTAGKSSKEELVEIHTVPDFTAFMQKMNV